ncbi:MAG: hypothetical protein PHZ26_02900 [Candidatus Gracilibacteria bacterium]|nr:hypothetical protein [Candidatus Gracilibacteria bacterium]MDD2908677.1 hypothetical protein [Candidatus Gracilibacteria bacterium]
MKKNKVDKIKCNCKPFLPLDFQDKEIIWVDKTFIKDHVTSFFHVHLNMGSIIKKNIKKIGISENEHDYKLILTSEKSLFGTDIYFEIGNKIKYKNTIKMSGIFHTKVFEGPLRNVLKRKEEMIQYMNGKGKKITEIYYFYATCPSCARKFGKNYVVIFAKEK